MPQFKNVTGADVDLFRPAELGGRVVAAGDVVDVPGRIVTSRPKPKDGDPAPVPIPDDAYLVEDGGEERAWPHTSWELVTKTDTKADKEN